MNSTLFRQAAKKVNFDHYLQRKKLKAGACSALIIVTRSPVGYPYQFLAEYNDLLWDHFRPTQKLDTDANWDYWWDDPNSCSEEDNNARVMALLFCELIAEDENNEVPKNRF